MTPKEKAKQLFDNMYQVKDLMGNYPMCFDTAKQCALIAVDEIIDNAPFRDYGFKYDSVSSRIDAVEKYWLEVKSELETM